MFYYTLWNPWKICFQKELNSKYSKLDCTSGWLQQFSCSLNYTNRRNFIRRDQPRLYRQQSWPLNQQFETVNSSVYETYKQKHHISIMIWPTHLGSPDDFIIFWTPTCFKPQQITSTWMILLFSFFFEEINVTSQSSIGWWVRFPADANIFEIHSFYIYSLSFDRQNSLIVS